MFVLIIEVIDNELSERYLHMFCIFVLIKTDVIVG